MAFSDFVKSNYAEVCRQKRNPMGIDNPMKQMLQNRQQDWRLVQSWMKDYGLFQGIPSGVRERVSQQYISVIYEIIECTDATDRLQLKRAFETLFLALFEVEQRKWLSATSKLLWCAFPDDVVIYDSFVERVLIVLQWLMPELEKYPRLNIPPSFRGRESIDPLVDYYMRYQDMVKEILISNRPLLQDLRLKHNETYPHDIRIVDKLLWIMGNPR